MRSSNLLCLRQIGARHRRQCCSSTYTVLFANHSLTNWRRVSSDRISGAAPPQRGKRRSGLLGFRRSLHSSRAHSRQSSFAKPSPIHPEPLSTIVSFSPSRRNRHEDVMAKSAAATNGSEQLRSTAEEAFGHELEALAKADDKPRPPGWKLSPQAVVTYLMGGKLKGGIEITPKYIGNRRLIETAVATLATDRALLLLGIPGTAKSWVSEHLAAAVSGNSQRLIQCTAGTDENHIRYGWNYALL